MSICKAMRLHPLPLPRTPLCFLETAQPLSRLDQSAHLKDLGRPSLEKCRSPAIPHHVHPMRASHRPFIQGLLNENMLLWLLAPVSQLVGRTGLRMMPAQKTGERHDMVSAP